MRCIFCSRFFFNKNKSEFLRHLDLHKAERVKLSPEMQFEKDNNNGQISQLGVLLSLKEEIL